MVCCRSMIIKENMMAPMLVACPSFAPLWREFCEDWADEETDPPYYVALGALARHLVDRIQADEKDRFDAIFAVVEDWHVKGDDDVKEAATVGFLESLQNIADNTGVDPRLYVPWLGPETQKWWDKLGRFWDGDAGALSED